LHGWDQAGERHRHDFDLGFDVQALEELAQDIRQHVGCLFGLRVDAK